MSEREFLNCHDRGNTIKLNGFHTMVFKEARWVLNKHLRGKQVLSVKIYNLLTLGVNNPCPSKADVGPAHGKILAEPNTTNTIVSETIRFAKGNTTIPGGNNSGVITFVTPGNKIVTSVTGNNLVNKVVTRIVSVPCNC